MFKKIQQYLLLHHPLLWNIKIVPTLIGAILLNLFFWYIGYSFTEIDFKSSRWSSGDFPFFIYFGAVILGILYLIFWLISYSKNNAFKVFYPKKWNALYTEWILVFTIVFSVILVPHSVNLGINTKLKSYVTKDELVDAIDILNKVAILIPNNKRDYYEEYPNEKYRNDASKKRHANQVQVENYDIDIVVDTMTAEVNDEMTTVVIDDEEAEYESPSAVDTSVAMLAVDEEMADAERNQVVFEDHPNFRQLSLLNYNRGGFYNYSYRCNSNEINVGDVNDVKEWLRAEDKEKISKLMDDFLDLQEKHGLRTNLTKEKWFSLIYNPSQYPVGDFNLIGRYAEYDPSYTYTEHEYYLAYGNLNYAYDRIADAHLGKDVYNMLLFYICVSLCLSILIFSFKVTSGKSWLIGLVSIGLIIAIDFFMSLVTGISSENEVSGLVLFLGIMLFLFIFEFVYVQTRKYKGKTNIMINHLLWFVPVIPVLIFALVYLISKENCQYYVHPYHDYVGNEHSHTCLHKFMDKHILEFMWGNVCLTYVSMLLFCRFTLLKWKGLPEE